MPRRGADRARRTRPARAPAGRAAGAGMARDTAGLPSTSGRAAGSTIQSTSNPRCRSAAATGSVCTTSPMAESRTRSAFIAGAAPAASGCRGPSRRRRWPPGPRRTAPPRARAPSPACSRCPCSGRPGAGRGSARVTSSSANTTTWSTSRSAATSSRAVAFRHHRTAFALQPAHRGVAVDADHQHVRFRARALRGSARGRRAGRRSSRWPGRPSGPRRAPRAPAARPRRACPPSTPPSSPHAPRTGAPGAGSAATARRSSAADTVAVPRFITTTPPA